jgi:hypothetical protein
MPSGGVPPGLRDEVIPGHPVDRLIDLKTDRLNHWVTIGANVGVIVGLILLIVEVRQNASLTRTAMELQKNAALAQVELSLTPETAAAWVTSIRAPAEMTDVELRLVEAHLVAVMLTWDNLFLMQESGLVSAARVRRHVFNTAPYYFGSAHARNWWRLQTKGWDGTQMMEVAGPIVEHLDDDFLLTNLDASRLVRLPESAAGGHDP